MGRTVAVDLDEVLGFFIQQLCKFHNDEYGTNLSQSDFFSYTFADVWGGSREDSISKVYKFFESKYFEEIPCVPGAKKAIEELRYAGFDLVVVTSRQYVIEQATRAWVNRHYPGLFREIGFGNHWGKEGKKVSKKDICVQLGATALIDDSLAYAEEASANGIHAILFDFNGDYRWNKTKDNSQDPTGVTRVQNWDEAVQAVLALR